MPPTKSPLDPLALRHAFASFATGVTVITARDALGTVVGLTANSFGSVSLDPPLVQWSLRINSALHRSFVEATMFSVSVLAANQEAVARQFASRAPDRFAGIEVTGRGDEPPLVKGALAHFVCRKVNDYRVGDHELFVGEVLRASATEGHPLLFFGSRFMTA
jgi:3-hydroxy-9,10-secoandrosta-1,3,5(10)-triene-9,17-dione monooxygenase reductase component